MQQELLYGVSVSGGKSLYGPVNVAVVLALWGNNILVGICKALHYEYTYNTHGLLTGSGMGTRNDKRYPYRSAQSYR